MSNQKKVLVGALAMLLGFLAYKGIEKYLEIEDFGFNDDEIFGM